MIVGMNDRCPAVNVEFLSSMNNMYIRTKGILSTGCGITSVSLGVLLNPSISTEELKCGIEHLKYCASDYLIIENSGIGIVPSIFTYIDNVGIISDMGNILFNRIYVRLELNLEPKLIRLGYDFIMSHRIVMNCNNRFVIDDFDINRYNDLWRNRRVLSIDKIMSYMSLPVSII